MFYKRNASGYQSPMKGIEQKTLVYGEKTLMVEFKLQKNNELPRHRHPIEDSIAIEIFSPVREDYLPKAQ